ncbi:hydrolase [Corynebacterium phage CL31]|nr:hydrolase [Corynebacterium phage CL31]
MPAGVSAPPTHKRCPPPLDQVTGSRFQERKSPLTLPSTPYSTSSNPSGKQQTRTSTPSSPPQASTTTTSKTPRSTKPSLAKKPSPRSQKQSKTGGRHNQWSLNDGHAQNSINYSRTGTPQSTSKTSNTQSAWCTSEHTASSSKTTTTNPSKCPCE